MHPDAFFDLPEPVDRAMRAWVAQMQTKVRESWTVARMLADPELSELDMVLRQKRGSRR